MESSSHSHEEGHSLLELVTVLALVGVILSGASVLFLNLARTAASISAQQVAITSALKTHGIITAALRSTERDRLNLSVSITPGNNLTLAHGMRHPVAAMTGTSAPRLDSDVLSFIDLDNTFRGLVRSSRVSSTSAELEVCGLNSIPSPTSHRSYLLLSVSGAHQLSGDLRPTSRGCALLAGSFVAGLVGSRSEIPSSFSGFVPIEREYSLYVDRSGNVRLVAHVGARIVENQPMVRGIYSIRLSESKDPSGILMFQLWIKPTTGPEMRRNIIPTLGRRTVIGEVLP